MKEFTSANRAKNSETCPGMKFLLLECMIIFNAFLGKPWQAFQTG